MRGVNADRDGTVLEQGYFKSVCIVGSDIDIASDGSNHFCVVDMAVSIL